MSHVVIDPIDSQFFPVGFSAIIAFLARKNILFNPFGINVFGNVEALPPIALFVGVR